jgi:hypothetical protein
MAGTVAPVKVEAPRMASATTISPKAILAATLPAIATLAAIIVQWAVTGEFDKAELTTAIVGVVTSALSGLGAYLGAPGNVQVEAEVRADVPMSGTVRRVP